MGIAKRQKNSHLGIVVARELEEEEEERTRSSVSLGFGVWAAKKEGSGGKKGCMRI